MEQWYKERIVYQIYPRSYKDSNNDGFGDLKGIISKLDYLKELGIGIVWLSPIYKSPQDDNGYDISDYRDIDPMFGTLDDFKELINGLHQRDIKLVMDLVVNHTSDEHKWFIEAKSSKTNPYHDYYLWKEKPNNWTSMFGGEAWEYNEATNEYYLHLFSKKQPDLNWENPKVREEIKGVLKYWLDMGVDGFRCDVINMLSKTHGLPNGKKSLVLTGPEHFINGPRIHEYLQELNNDVLSKYDCFTVGECVFINPQRALEFMENKELTMLFQFEHMNADAYFVKWFIKKFKFSNLKKPMNKWQTEVNGKGWNTLYLENHDQARSLNRFGDLDYRVESAKFLATYLCFMQGTPYIYQGQEIGMTNPNFANLADYKDVETRNITKLLRKLHFTEKRIMKKVLYASRDNARTPMQWDDSKYAGFSEVEPWIKVNKNYPLINVNKDIESPESIFKYYQKIISLRKEYPIIVYGDYKEYYLHSNSILYYERNYMGDKLIVLGNYSKKARKMPNINLSNAKELLNNYNSTEKLFKPYQIVVYLIERNK